MTIYERISLNTIAWKSAYPETFPYSCSTCSEEMKKEFNCDMTCPKDVIEDPEEEIILQSCPINYILDQHIDFQDKYWYVKEFPSSMPTYEQCDKKFWEWYAFFRNKYAIYEVNKQKDSTKQG